MSGGGRVIARIWYKHGQNDGNVLTVIFDDNAWRPFVETAMDEKDLFADGAAYEHYVGRWSRPVGRMFLDWLSQPPGLCWADVGCGTGALTGVVLKEAEPKSVLGVEPSEGFLGVARSSIKDPRVDLRSGDA